LSLDVVVTEKHHYDMLFNTLSKLIENTLSARAAASPDELYLRDMWDRGDADRSGTLTTNEVIQLVSSMNISMPASTIKKIFKKFDSDGSGSLNFEEFTQFIALLRER
jgi:Ca2+-binding EF-hand superfamily protein